MGMYGDKSKEGIRCGPSRTKQSFRKQCDINELVRKYKRDGEFTNVTRKQPFYGDVSAMRGYHEAMTIVAAAQQTFEALPVEVRERFGYDAGKMVAFFEDPANLEEAIRRGWAKRRPDPLAAPKDGAGSGSAAGGGAGTGSAAAAAPKAS